MRIIIVGASYEDQRTYQIAKEGQRENVVRHRERDEELAKAIIKRRGLK